MTLDLDRKRVTKNAFRITKVRDCTAIRVRVPGGHLDSETLRRVAAMADEFGDGSLHITTRQGFEIPNIPFERMAEVNAAMNRTFNQTGRYCCETMTSSPSTCSSGILGFSLWSMIPINGDMTPNTKYRMAAK